MGMDNILSSFKEAKREYDKGDNPLQHLCDISKSCLKLIAKSTTNRHQGRIGTKEYSVFEAKGETSRPFLPALFIPSPVEFSKRWKGLITKIDKKGHTIQSTTIEIDSVLYTSIMAFSVCFDLWKRTSRKTPGTYFEVMLGSILGEILQDYKRTKHIPLISEEVTEEENEESVSTDIVFEKAFKDGTRKGIVIPAKITTRERIVQPFAHQRILDGVFSSERFRSVLVCMSEMQLDRNSESVKEICVPGTIRLFQAHLAKLSGIYYLDPPLRYLQDDVLKCINVASLGKFLNQELAELA